MAEPPTDIDETLAQIESRFLSLANPDIAAHAQRFFKTGQGEYGEGDRFLGLRVPVIRREVKEHKNADLNVAQALLFSPFHELRLFALLLLVARFQKAKAKEQATIYSLYLRNTDRINNWDLVDSSAPQIIGAYLETRDRAPLYRLAESDSLWERRIAIMATFHLIRKNDYTDALCLSEILLHDTEDLIHKAVGWMLRETGKRDKRTETDFLDQHYRIMPRTMLRYAIEKFPETERQRYLKGTA